MKFWKPRKGLPRWHIPRRSGLLHRRRMMESATAACGLGLCRQGEGASSTCSCTSSASVTV